MGNVDWRELLRWVPGGSDPDHAPRRADHQDLSGAADAGDEGIRPAPDGG